MTAHREFRGRAKLMGSTFEFILVAPGDRGASLIDQSIAEVRRIEELLTEFKETSATSIITSAAGRAAVQVDEEVYQLLTRAVSISRLTQGAFDITTSTLKRLYNFKGKDFVLPSPSKLQAALRATGYDKLQLGPNRHVRLTREGMRISFAAIGKGYAADCVRRMLTTKGIRSGVISASGDLTAWGVRPDGSPWMIGIADPDCPSRALLQIPIRDSCIATSGDYEQYFECGGQRYAHTIDPKTGIPIKHVKSVSVISPSAELSDALATAVFVMGPAVGLHFIAQLPGTHAVIMDTDNNLHMSPHIQAYETV